MWSLCLFRNSLHRRHLVQPALACICICRQVKEREVEDHLFGDKEKFVTAAYKKKLQEQKLWEAQQKLKCAQSIIHQLPCSTFGT